MRKITLVVLILFSFCEKSPAQCGKKLLITASKTIHMDSGGNITRTGDKRSEVHISGDSIIINVNGEHRTTCTIKSSVCNWIIPFKEGKTVFKAAITNDENQIRNVTMTISGTNGELFILFEMEGNEEVVKVMVDRFEEDV